MKYGVHVALWMTHWTEDIDRHLRTVAELGFDGAEISLLGMSDQNTKHLRRLILDCGLEVTCTTGLSVANDIASDDATTRKRGIENLRWAIETTADLGSNLLTGVVYAPWGHFVPGQKLERLKRSSESLAAISDVLADSEVTLGVEAINRFETDMVNTANEACELVERIGSDHIGVLLDAFHMNIEEKNIRDAIKNTGSRLAHFHCVENDRGVPGSGHTPWEEIFSGLRAVKYDRWLTMEMFIKADVAVSPDLNIWRSIEQDPTTAAKEGLRFLKEKTADFN